MASWPPLAEPLQLDSPFTQTAPAPATRLQSCPTTETPEETVPHGFACEPDLISAIPALSDRDG